LPWRMIIRFRMPSSYMVPEMALVATELWQRSSVR
jgi:hypothetical protein